MNGYQSRHGDPGAARPPLRDAAPLRAFRAEYGKAARAGLLLHIGSTVEWLAPNVLAVPW